MSPRHVFIIYTHLSDVFHGSPPYFSITQYSSGSPLWSDWSRSVCVESRAADNTDRIPELNLPHIGGHRIFIKDAGPPRCHPPLHADPTSPAQSSQRSISMATGSPCRKKHFRSAHSAAAIFSLGKLNPFAMITADVTWSVQCRGYIYRGIHPNLTNV